MYKRIHYDLVPVDSLLVNNTKPGGLRATAHYDCPNCFKKCDTMSGWIGSKLGLQLECRHCGLSACLLSQEIDIEPLYRTFQIQDFESKAYHKMQEECRRLKEKVKAEKIELPEVFPLKELEYEKESK